MIKEKIMKGIEKEMADINKSINILTKNLSKLEKVLQKFEKEQNSSEKKETHQKSTKPVEMDSAESQSTETPDDEKSQKLIEEQNWEITEQGQEQPHTVF